MAPVIPCALMGAMGAGAAMAAPPWVAPYPAWFDLSTLTGPNGFILRTDESRSYLGHALAFAGDMNGDGFDDAVIGAHYSRLTHIIFGGEHVNTTGLMHPDELDGATGFTFRADPKQDKVGPSVKDAGDVNGDGFADIIIGAQNVDLPGKPRAGRAYIILGGPGVGDSGLLQPTDLSGANGFVINGAAAHDRFGFSVGPAGDLNGDGFDDVAIGALWADPNGLRVAGTAYVLFGAPNLGASGVIEASAITGTAGFHIVGNNAGRELGSSVGACGDVNGDGFDDLIIGAKEDPPSGAAYDDGTGLAVVIFGKPNVGAAGIISLCCLPSQDGLFLIGHRLYDRAGISVGGAGDVNGDGFADILVGATGADVTGGSQAGRAYLVFGSSDIGAAGPLNLGALGTRGFEVSGTLPFDGVGSSVAGIGDINSDGFDDFAIGATGGGPTGASWSDLFGAAYIFLGGPAIGASGAESIHALDGTNGFTVFGLAGDDGLGAAVAGNADFNGDGRIDLLLGAPFASTDAQTAGEACVILDYRRVRTPAFCPADLDGDEVVNAADFTIFATAYGTAVPPGTGADLNADGLVNAADFVVFAGDFGCGP